MASGAVEAVQPLSFVWDTEDPFLFCVHHRDNYPEGNKKLGPNVSISGRAIGSDFSQKDGWSMYHGDVVPGFPRHPHRGFETVTLARSGLIDHADSLGATARFGRGDCQWLTTGRGIEHSEMFPLVKPDAPNPCELFQIWLNLPARSKMVPPYFTMLWRDTIPSGVYRDGRGRETVVVSVSGPLPPGGSNGGAIPGKPPPDSWAAPTDNEVAIWTIKMAPGAEWDLPGASEKARRRLYLFQGPKATVAGTEVPARHMAVLSPTATVHLQNPSEAEPVEFLLLQGRPIGEPVAQRGPFVMNNNQEIMQAMTDYRAGMFGKWPWGADDPNHGLGNKRFAIHADGRREERED